MFYRIEKHPRILSICKSFQEAIDTCQSNRFRDEIDSIWIMGGAKLYEVVKKHLNNKTINNKFLESNLAQSVLLTFTLRIHAFFAGFKVV